MSENPTGKAEKPQNIVHTPDDGRLTSQDGRELSAPPRAPQKSVPNLHVLLGTDDGRSAKKKGTAKSNAKPATFAGRQIKRIKIRHAIIAITFLLFVVLPASAVTLYMAFVASNQYHSSASFSVRSIEAASAGDILGIFSQSSGSSATSDGFILIDYIRSEEMLTEISQNFDIEKTFARRGADFFYALSPGISVERKLEYWRKMVNVTFDHASGIMTLELKAFTPEDAAQLAAFILGKSEDLINRLSDRARQQVVNGAQKEVEIAEARLTKARADVRQYRDLTQEVDPTENAKLASQLIGELEGRIVALNTSLAAAKKQMTEDSPRIKVMRAQIGSLNEQLVAARQRLGSGVSGTGNAATGDVAGRILEFQNLATEQEFAERAYTAAMASLEKARIDAANKERYLATFIKPTLSEEAQYPKRFLNSLLALLGCLFAWSVGVMVYYNIRDRA